MKYRRNWGTRGAKPVFLPNTGARKQEGPGFCPEQWIKTWKLPKKIFAIDIIHLLTNIFFVIYFENQNNLISKYFILKQLCGDEG